MLVTFHMKSGNEIVIECETLKTSRSHLDHKLTSYELTYPEDYRGRKLHTLNLEDIEAITVVEKKRADGDE